MQTQKARISLLESQLLATQQSAADEAQAHQHLAQQLEIQVDQLEASGRRKDGEHSAHVETLELTHRDEKSRLQRSFADLERRLSESDRSKQDLRSRITLMEDQLQQEIVAVFSLKSQVAELEDKLETLETEKRIVQIRNSEKLTATENSLDEQKRIVRDVRRELEALDAQRLHAVAQAQQVNQQQARDLAASESANQAMELALQQAGTEVSRLLVGLIVPAAMFIL